MDRRVSLSAVGICCRRYDQRICLVDDGRRVTDNVCAQWPGARSAQVKRMTALTSIVVASELSRVYGTGETRVTALDAVSFEIAPRDRLALVGQSGSGKTTLLNLLAGLDRPTSGELTVAGQNLSQASRSRLAEFRLRQIGVVFQSFQLIPSRTALQNVELPLILAGIERDRRRQRSRDALAQVGLSARLDHLPGKLSGGEQQRVAIARAIVHRPDLLLADEPTGNLDSKTAGVVMELLLNVVEEKKTAMLLITHDESMARQCTDQIVRLVDGRVAEQRLS